MLPSPVAHTSNSSRQVSMLSKAARNYHKLQDFEAALTDFNMKQGAGYNPALKRVITTTMGTWGPITTGAVSHKRTKNTTSFHVMVAAIQRSFFRIVFMPRLDK